MKTGAELRAELTECRQLGRQARQEAATRREQARIRAEEINTHQGTSQ